MSFGGHVNDMVNRIKQNAALKNARRRKFKKGNKYSSFKTTKTEYNVPNVSKSQIDLIKKRIQKEAKLEKIKQLRFWFFALLLPLIIGFLIFNFY